MMILQYYFTLSISSFFCECLLIEDKKLSERSKFGSKFNWHRLQLHFMIFFLLLGWRKEQRERMCEREMLEFGNDDDFSLLKRQSYYMRQPQILIFSCSVLCVYVHINLVHDSISAKGKMSWYLPARCIGAIKIGEVMKECGSWAWSRNDSWESSSLRIFIKLELFLFIIHHSLTWFAQSKFYFYSSQIAYASEKMKLE